MLVIGLESGVFKFKLKLVGFFYITERDAGSSVLRLPIDKTCEMYFVRGVFIASPY
jgi:hypothetical protein